MSRTCANRLLPLAALLALAGCKSSAAERPALPFKVTEMGRFAEPWAMTFLPDGRALVTERKGAIKIWAQDGKIASVSGGPKVVYRGQGGLGDVALHPGFARNGLVYLSWVEGGAGGTSGAVVGRAKLAGTALQGLTVIWRQSPKVGGSGHFGHRLAFAPDGSLFISSGERQKFDPAQDTSVNIGKIVRAADDGGGGAQTWSLGHRNPLGLAFDASGRLWEMEMGPRGGDELNLIEKGANYGWPRASNGSHYDGRDIPDHRSGDGFAAPKLWWNPSISPSSLMIYSGALFPQWQGDAFIGALSGEALIRIDLDGANAKKSDEWPMSTRIREVEQGPDGAIWLLEDGDDARLLRLTPR